MENGHVTEGQLNGGQMVILRRWPGKGRENGHVTEVVILMGGRMVMLQRWSL